MRRALLPLALCLGAAGCASLAVHWEKPGVDPTATQRDLADCRIAARDESMRNYYPAPAPLFGAHRWGLWDQHSESQRFYAESNLTRFCMRNKGYELVPDQPPAKTLEK